MGPFTLITLVGIVVGVAYGLGLWMRARDKTRASVVDAKPRITPRARPAKPAAMDERQLQAVVDWLLTQAFEQTGIRVADEPLAYQRIAEAARLAMRDLQTQEAVSISLPFLTADVTGPKHFETRLTREVIDELARY